MKQLSQTPGDLTPSALSSGWERKQLLDDEDWELVPLDEVESQPPMMTSYSSHARVLQLGLLPKGDSDSD